MCTSQSNVGPVSALKLHPAGASEPFDGYVNFRRSLKEKNLVRDKVINFDVGWMKDDGRTVVNLGYDSGVEESSSVERQEMLERRWSGREKRLDRDPVLERRWSGRDRERPKCGRNILFQRTMSNSSVDNSSRITFGSSSNNNILCLSESVVRGRVPRTNLHVPHSNLGINIHCGGAQSVADVRAMRPGNAVKLSKRVGTGDFPSNNNNLSNVIQLNSSLFGPVEHATPHRRLLDPDDATSNIQDYVGQTTPVIYENRPPKKQQMKLSVSSDCPIKPTSSYRSPVVASLGRQSSHTDTSSFGLSLSRLRREMVSLRQLDQHVHQQLLQLADNLASYRQSTAGHYESIDPIYENFFVENVDESDYLEPIPTRIAFMTAYESHC